MLNIFITGVGNSNLNHPQINWGKTIYQLCLEYMTTVDYLFATDPEKHDRDGSCHADLTHFNSSEMGRAKYKDSRNCSVMRPGYFYSGDPSETDASAWRDIWPIACEYVIFDIVIVVSRQPNVQKCREEISNLAYYLRENTDEDTSWIVVLDPGFPSYGVSSLAFPFFANIIERRSVWKKGVIRELIRKAVINLIIRKRHG